MRSALILHASRNTYINFDRTVLQDEKPQRQEVSARVSTGPSKVGVGMPFLAYQILVLSTREIKCVQGEYSVVFSVNRLLTYNRPKHCLNTTEY